jgi:peptidoglycan hydrolase-like protein with peptidoglycan-binding domain
MKNISNIAVTTFLSLMIIVVSLQFNSVTVFSAQKGQGYKMPFRNTETWATDFDYGVHQDSVGYGFDFYAPSNSNKEILAVADGILTRGCSVNGSTRLRLDTNSGDIVRFFHMRTDSVPIEENEDVYVNVGDIIGRVTDGGVFNTNNCRLSSDTAHLHMSWPAESCPFRIDGNEFSCNDMKNCAGIGVYQTFCNRKYLGSSFKSTNQALDFNNDCNVVKNKEFSIGQKGLEIVRLQRCLIADGLYKYSGGVSGYFGNYTSGVQNEWKKRQLNNNQGQTTAQGDKCYNILGENYLIGQASEKVRSLQQCLKDRGLFNWSGGLTGYYGNYTNSVYLEWLNKNPETCKYLKGLTIPSGERSDRIKELQQCLREAGLFTYSVNTGFYGPITQEAHKKW